MVARQPLFPFMHPCNNSVTKVVNFPIALPTHFRLKRKQFNISESSNYNIAKKDVDCRPLSPLISSSFRREEYETMMCLPDNEASAIVSKQRRHSQTLRE